MAYSELIKNFDKIRDYMREFYVYGFKSREEYTAKSARSYDDERRRVESWLGDYMRFRRTPDGKNLFLSVDSRLSRRNPLYQAWKTKSFTDGDITLHFILFDILDSPDTSLSLGEITEAIDGYLAGFAEPRVFDSSTVRKKLKEYIGEGLILTEKRGKTLYYRRAADPPLGDTPWLPFFSEVAPCGVIGSYLLDKEGLAGDTPFAFKHHYITGTMDSEILCALFLAMGEKRAVILSRQNRRRNHPTRIRVIPLRIFMSVQSGRQYLMGYIPALRRITSFRLDRICSVKAGEPCPDFDRLRQTLAKMQPHIWGVSTDSDSGKRLEQVSFTIRYGENEQYIAQRLEREKRCGRVERLDAHTLRFTAEVYNAAELIPWMRSFICRITAFHFSDPATEAQFRNDLQTMYRLYGLAGEEEAP